MNNEILKTQVLTILQNNKDNLISGSFISNKLKITRSYVSLLIQSLKDDGYNIVSIKRNGYIYKDNHKVIDVELLEASIPYKVYYFNEITSTNDFAKKLNQESIDKALIIANYQTMGKGRRNRSFISQKGKGLYMSILLHNKFSVQSALKITTGVAVAVTKTLEDLTHQTFSIKWVNDVFLNNKKVCGILTEASTSMETGFLDYVVIGIGINVYHQIFDEILTNVATTIEDETKLTLSRNDLIINLVKNIDNILLTIDNPSIMAMYRKRCFLIGRNVEIIMQDKIIKAKITNINQEGELVIEDQGIEKVIYSGEVVKVLF